jgi:hypothetical protein
LDLSLSQKAEIPHSAWSTQVADHLVPNQIPKPIEIWLNLMFSKRLILDLLRAARGKLLRFVEARGFCSTKSSTVIWAEPRH